MTKISGYEKEELESFLEADEHHLVIDDTSLDKELALQAARYMFFGEKAILAEREFDLFKQKISQIKSEVEKKYRASFLSSGAKAPTERMVEAELNSNPSLVSLEHQLLQLKGKRDVAKLLKESMWMRKDLLIQMSIAKRAEMESIRSSVVKEKIAS